MTGKGIDRAAIDRLLDWMADGGRPESGARAIIQRMCETLLAAGIPLQRFALFIFFLHPNIGGRRFLWTRGGTAEMREAPHDVILSPMVQRSPAMAVMKSGTALRQRLTPDAGPFAFQDHADMAAEGLTDTLVQPLPFTTGGTYAASWSTAAPDGFSDEHISVLEEVRPLLARLTETYILRLNASSLLTAYVGRGGGERILAGHIEKGDTEIITAAILFADFKGFTRLSTSVEGRTVIETLNRFFDILVAAVQDEGGEVLKFLGDGMLAIFPLGHGADRRATLAAARAATAAAAAGLAAANADRPEAPPLAFRAGLCLGDVHFGNIGGGGRLDFTAIGPAVNLASRLLGVAAETGADFVCDAEAAAHFADAAALGEFALKGIAAPVAVYALPAGVEEAVR